MWGYAPGVPEGVPQFQCLWESIKFLWSDFSLQFCDMREGVGPVKNHLPYWNIHLIVHKTGISHTHTHTHYLILMNIITLLFGSLASRYAREGLVSTLYHDRTPQQDFCRPMKWLRDYVMSIKTEHAGERAHFLEGYRSSLSTLQPITHCHNS